MCIYVYIYMCICIYVYIHPASRCSTASRTLAGNIFSTVYCV